jgi:hypothetical protein
MVSTWVITVFKIAIFALIIIAGFGQAVLQLWNLLIPAIFGLRPITFWQAVGLLGLCWILFGGLGMFRLPPSRARHWQHRLAERWEHMHPEEREQFRQGVKTRCGRAEASEPEPKA